MIRCLSTAGSSPHTRGTPISYPYRSLSVRFIPAYAGNALPSDRLVFPRAVHPRIRGERRGLSGSPFFPPGSSPHTRGTQHKPQRPWFGTRFIPAYAGNACLLSQQLPDVPVHPRIRGERDGCFQLNARDRRFIPAYAGNARLSADRQGRPSVHPRIRGERGSMFSVGRSCGGSSPHTRGTPTPGACWSCSRAVHPRIRGERARLNRRVSAHAGSSPHTRGTHHDVCHAGIRRRFIPAYAGNAA